MTAPSRPAILMPGQPSIPKWDRVPERKVVRSKLIAEKSQPSKHNRWHTHSVRVETLECGHILRIRSVTPQKARSCVACWIAHHRKSYGKLHAGIVIDGVRITTKAIVAFWARIDKRGPRECWPWEAANTKGYGIILIGTARVHVTHIAAYIKHGPSPRGKKHACHDCDNPPCCNPGHLFWGSRSDNHSDAASKGRCATQRHPEIVRGERNGSAKLTEKQVIEIYTSNESRSQTATRMKISTGIVKAIRERKNWAHTTIDLVRGKVECKNTWPFRKSV